MRARLHNELVRLGCYMSGTAMVLAPFTRAEHPVRTAVAFTISGIYIALFIFANCGEEEVHEREGL